MHHQETWSTVPKLQKYEGKTMRDYTTSNMVFKIPMGLQTMILLFTTVALFQMEFYLSKKKA